MPQAENRRSLVPALDRAMRLLDLLSENPRQPFSVSEIARALGIPKSSTFNICSALVEGQMLRRNGQSFQLGRKLIELGSSYASSVDLVREFYNALVDVPLNLGAIIQLAVLDEHLDTVYLGQQDCSSGLRLGLGGGIGRRMPTNCTACGKAMLALFSPDELEDHFKGRTALPAMTEKSITDPARLIAEVNAIRENGDYAFDAGEAVPGLRCVARAFRTSHAGGGKVAISISASSHTLTDERQALFRETLDRVVANLKQHV